MKWTVLALTSVVVAAGLGAACAGPAGDESGNEPSATAADLEAMHTASVNRTREQILMLDDLYKTAVVLITEHYVQDTDTLSAATAAKALFQAMRENGWHDVRLLGLTDELRNPENAPADEFETAAAAALLAGERSYEEVQANMGTESLRLATALPVVMEKCVMCHPTWEGNTGNIGALSYTVPLID